MNERPPFVDWETAPLPDLVDHIELRYHRPLKRELPRLRTLLKKARGRRFRERFDALDEALVDLREEVEPHLRKEEAVLFPWIRAGRGESAAMAVKVVTHEHEAVRSILAGIRVVTDGFVAPEGANAPWRELWERLRVLEQELLAHMRLENDVLFPRALS